MKKKLKKTEFRCVVCNDVYKSVDGEWAYHKRVEALHCAQCAIKKRIKTTIKEVKNKIKNGDSDYQDVLYVLLEFKKNKHIKTCLLKSPRSF